MVKLWISDKLELRYSPEGWPDHDQQPHDYIKAIAKAKKESISILGVYPDSLTNFQWKPDTFVDYAGEVEVVGQWYWLDGWHDCVMEPDEYNKRFKNGNKVRKIARLKKAENASHSFTEGSDPGVGQYYDKAHVPEVTSLSEKLKQATIKFLLNQQDKPFIAKARRTFTTHELAKEITDETDEGIHVLKGLLVLATDQVLRGKKAIGYSMKSEVLEAFKARFHHFKNDEDKILSEVLDELGIK